MNNITDKKSSCPYCRGYARFTTNSFINRIHPNDSDTALYYGEDKTEFFLKLLGNWHAYKYYKLKKFLIK